MWGKEAVKSDLITNVWAAIRRSKVWKWLCDAWKTYQMQPWKRSTSAFRARLQLNSQGDVGQFIVSHAFRKRDFFYSATKFLRNGKPISLFSN